MNLDEFITYCTIADFVVMHERFHPSWPHAWKEQPLRNDYYKLVVENDNFLARITYGKDDYRIVQARLTKVYTTNDEHLEQAGLRDIIKAFLPI